MAHFLHGFHRWRRLILVTLAVLAFVAAGVALDGWAG